MENFLKKKRGGKFGFPYVWCCFFAKHLIWSTVFWFLRIGPVIHLSWGICYVASFMIWHSCHISDKFGMSIVDWDRSRVVH